MNVHGNNPTTNMVFIQRNAFNINNEHFGKSSSLKKLTECPRTLYCIKTESYIYRVMYLLYNSFRRWLHTLQIQTINTVLLGADWK